MQARLTRPYPQVAPSAVQLGVNPETGSRTLPLPHPQQKGEGEGEGEGLASTASTPSLRHIYSRVALQNQRRHRFSTGGERSENSLHEARWFGVWFVRWITVQVVVCQVDNSTGRGLSGG